MTQVPEIETAISGLRAQVLELQGIVDLINVHRTSSSTAPTAVAADTTVPNNPTSTAMEVDSAEEATETKNPSASSSSQANTPTEGIPTATNSTTEDSENSEVVAQLRQEIVDLKTENGKLKYRLGHLCDAYDNQAKQLQELGQQQQ
ncbi:hypothetical protein H4R33_003522 [Dimargaris cristalligena]|uniref:Uncharacterized protein n=1 Tax=Dimargaris cristalligena TaxID=215637 RepID=A0A4P9ZRG6_9FUNG|nr:hypothetical protein H4R33_003522 [Dimargaris cristalligena]RKP36043.1 hypothetical protein BJ085DRAFT_41030 [Dimargaris cristalligena]|eukprot:RKP36043.1 hypothetical protein BJ085DRAFT_41030 [Dimargaris cristalligena]